MFMFYAYIYCPKMFYHNVISELSKKTLTEHPKYCWYNT